MNFPNQFYAKSAVLLVSDPTTSTLTLKKKKMCPSI
uniref:Uncharacterized protein n=1 Tax=Rhizophora mucronata TaxID=61149 RepID=A0A2P2NSH9_RHIMU